MPLDRNQLHKIDGINFGRTFWCYATTDAAAVVDTAGYFNGAADMLQVGDLIIRQTYDAVPVPTAITSVGFHVVNANSGGVVDITDAVSLQGVDTD